MEAWIRAIPESNSHGTGTYQKRLWRLVSDYVRIRDWYKYKSCVATHRSIEHWKEGQAGHFKPYSICNAEYKFNPENIHLQSANSNHLSSQEDGYNFGEELKRRYGKGILKQIDENNKHFHAQKLTQTRTIELMRDIIDKMGTLPEKPEYYSRVISLM